MNKNAAVLLLLASPFLLGFSFLGDLKNEKGNELYKKGQVGKAKTQYLGAMKSDPKSPEIAYNLGNAFYKEGAFKESLGAYEKGAKTQKDPSLLSKAFYNLGNSLYRNQDPVKAIEFYKQALRLNPRDEDAKYNLELLLKKTPPQDQDKQKDQQKQDQQKNQDQKKQDQNKQDQGGGSGGEGSKDEQPQKPEGEGQDQQQGGGQGEEQDKKDQKEEQSDQQKPSGEGEEPGKPDQKEGDQPKNEEPQGQEPSDAGEEQDEKEQKPGEEQGQAKSGEPGEEKEKEPASGAEEAKPRTEADIRTEQILSALENQEQQVLKFQNNPDNPRVRARASAEKDW